MAYTNKSQSLANKFRENLGFTEERSKSGSLLLFNELTFIDLYCERFGIVDSRDTFKEAFKVATGGVGNEITKVNSVISSALLPLLFFHRMYGSVITRSNGLRLTLDGIPYLFNRAFFEVRNKVVGRPSCVDVVLQSQDEATLLFLESKLTEFIDDCSLKPKTYGASYLTLYQNDTIQEVLKNAGVSAGPSKNGKLELTPTKSPQYLEGLKQSISHLIGIVKGPQDVDEECYTQEYCESYKKAFNKARTRIYATILFDPTDSIGAVEEFSTYRQLFESTIGDEDFGRKIVVAIEQWAKLEPKERGIKIIKTPLTYQEVLHQNPDFPLPDKVKRFYGFK